ncbi:MAG: hypothetical protein CMK83_24050 [Pseudomonadales bacterium]|nr:hypothetical protein [Pseudomonadales bacterium]MBI27130.1 hypothetical protein [Pseudomonadales bacterium]HAG96796.1 hypothetical protein [Gammaproteobacteria bacterium]|tara:strand:- start:908 stop:1096 length:189 start_codon:yes stop_codon:yes gene_type:complete
MAIKKTRSTFSLSIPLDKQIREMSEQTGIPVSRIVNTALEAWLKKCGETTRTNAMAVIGERT